jgi:hypothetical protein
MSTWSTSGLAGLSVGHPGEMLAEIKEMGTKVVSAYTGPVL